MNSKKAFLFPLMALAVGLGATAGLSAQTVSTTVASTTSGETLDLTGNGPTDWVQFGVSGTATGFSLSNEKSGGSVGGLDTVGAVSESNDSFAGMTEQTQTIETSYTDGSSPTSSTSPVTNGNTAGSWNIQSGFSGNNPPLNGATLSFTINFNQAISSGTILLGGDTFGVTEADLTASLSNGNTVVTKTGSLDNEQNDIFTIDVSNITAGSSLTLSWDMVTGNPTTFGTGTFDDLALSGVALNLTAAPEPSAFAMMFGGLVLLAGVLRFRRQFI